MLTAWVGVLKCFELLFHQFKKRTVDKKHMVISIYYGVSRKRKSGLVNRKSVQVIRIGS